MKQAEDPLLIDLALQDGGSHGAFTWGVLDPSPRRISTAYRDNLRDISGR